MNVKKSKPTRTLPKNRAKKAATRKAPSLAQQNRKLRHELAETKRERDSYLAEVYKRMQAETVAMNIDTDQLLANFGKGPSPEEHLRQLAVRLEK